MGLRDLRPSAQWTEEAGAAGVALPPPLPPYMFGAGRVILPALEVSGAATVAISGTGAPSLQQLVTAGTGTVETP